MNTIVDLVRDWLKTHTSSNVDTVVDIAALALKIGLDLGFGSDKRLDETERLEVQVKLNQALLAAGILEVV